LPNKLLVQGSFYSC